MRVIGAAEVEAALGYRDLVERLREAFRSEIAVPLRHHHTVPAPGVDPATLLLMPAWRSGRHIGIKIVTVFPGNPARSLPSIMGVYLLLDGGTGAPLALLDGPALTVRRTAAASALASSYLSRPDSSRLLVVGTGALAPELALAHSAVRPITEIAVWGRSLEKARAVAERLKLSGASVTVAEDLEAAAGQADIVTCATMAQEPLIRGGWLKEGAHLDLVGGFTPAMREADDSAVRRATIFVDTREGAMKEAGDIVQPLESGALTADAIAADLFDLAHGRAEGRKDDREITFFKSVGTALEDLAAAQLVHEKDGEKGQRP